MLVAQFTMNLGIDTQEAEEATREEEYLKMLAMLGQEEDTLQGVKTGVSYSGLRHRR